MPPAPPPAHDGTMEQRAGGRQCYRRAKTVCRNPTVGRTEQGQVGLLADNALITRLTPAIAALERNEQRSTPVRIGVSTMSVQRCQRQSVCAVRLRSGSHRRSRPPPGPISDEGRVPWTTALADAPASCGPDRQTPPADRPGSARPQPCISALVSATRHTSSEPWPTATSTLTGSHRASAMGHDAEDALRPLRVKPVPGSCGETRGERGSRRGQTSLPLASGRLIETPSRVASISVSLFSIRPWAASCRLAYANRRLFSPCATGRPRKRQRIVCPLVDLRSGRACRRPNRSCRSAEGTDHRRRPPPARDQGR